MHTIRLRRPWLRSVGDQDLPTKVDVPDTESPGLGGASIVTYRRPFNRPTGLEPGDIVWLSITRCSAGSIHIGLNDATIAEIDQSSAAVPIRVNITPYLSDANRLTIQLTGETQQDVVLNGEVSLQIES